LKISDEDRSRKIIREAMGLSGDDYALRGSFAARDLAERVMIEAAERAAREKREPERMLRVLALLASPVYDPANPEVAPVHLDLQSEWHRLAEGVRQSGAPILLARLVPPTLPALRAALSPRASEQGVFPQVLHFSGHAWEAGLVLEDEMGRVHSAKTPAVIDALKDIPRKIDLVILNGCESAAAAKSVAQALLDGGLARAVVGHEEKVLDDEAVAFAARLYSELCGGFSLKRALENAGKLITTHKVILLGDEEMRFEGLSGGAPMIDELRPRGALLPQARLFLERGKELVDMARGPGKAAGGDHPLRAARHRQVEPSPGGRFAKRMALSRWHRLCCGPDARGVESCQRRGPADSTGRLPGPGES
jgi:hypothetical protein